MLCGVAQLFTMKVVTTLKATAVVANLLQNVLSHFTHVFRRQLIGDAYTLAVPLSILASESYRYELVQLLDVFSEFRHRIVDLSDFPSASRERNARVLKPKLLHEAMQRTIQRLKKCV